MIEIYQWKEVMILKWTLTEMIIRLETTTYIKNHHEVNQLFLVYYKETTKRWTQL